MEGDCGEAGRQQSEVARGDGRHPLDEQQRVGLERSLEPFQRGVGGIAPIEHTYMLGEGKVEAGFAAGQGEIFDRNRPQLEQTRLTFGTRGRCGDTDGGGGAVDRDHLTMPDAAEHRARGDAGAAADLEHAHAGFEPQRGNELRDSGRGSSQGERRGLVLLVRATPERYCGAKAQT
ncbi:hypothetical protein PQS32_05030 [Sphingomonas koreensis]|nr:hypothetical protein [Sphingomonas koreensis]MDC7809497.1 hypothetical protein [Sphingomonas koreensis]